MCPTDEWENAIRKFGVQNACEWFGIKGNGDWAKETAKILAEPEYRAAVFYNQLPKDI